MVWLIWLALILVVLYFALKPKPSKERRASAPNARVISPQPSGGGEPWRRDPATQRQLNYIEELTGKKPTARMTKGEASAKIDSLLPADDDDLAVLKFFKVPTRGLRQKTAKAEVEKVLAEPGNLEAWKARPPAPETREIFRFIGEKLPPGTGHDDAESLLLQRLTEMREVEPQKAADAERYGDLLDNLADKDFREDCNIRKPSMTLVRKVIDDMLAEGLTYDKIFDDEGEFVERLIAADPKLERD